MLGHRLRCAQKVWTWYSTAAGLVVSEAPWSHTLVSVVLTTNLFLVGSLLSVLASSQLLSIFYPALGTKVQAAWKSVNNLEGKLHSEYLAHFSVILLPSRHWSLVLAALVVLSTDFHFLRSVRLLLAPRHNFCDLSSSVHLLANP